MIYVIATFLAQVGQEKEVENILRSVIKQMQTDTAVMMSHTYQSQTESRRFFLFVQFTNQDAIQAHRDAKDYTEGFLTNLYGRIDPESLFTDKYELLQ